MELFTANRLYKPSNHLFKIIIYLSIIAFFTNTCASIRPLEGGPQNIIPPKLLHTNPNHESMNNFQHTQRPVIRLTFDKEIEVHDIYNRLIITPKLPILKDKLSYTCEVYKNVLELKLGVPLEKDTTYTFNFKKGAICDTYESTPAENTILTFSTGPKLDEMYITGQVRFLMTNEPVAGALVTLYKLESEEENAVAPVHILNTNPDYFTESKEDGTFELQHIKEGRYRICAGKTKEDKLIIDPIQDMYGFLASPLELTKPIENITLQILKADNSELKVQSNRPNGPYFEINLSKPIKNNYSLDLKHIPKRLKTTILYSHLVDNNTTIRVYNTFGLLDDDRLETELIAEDEVGNKIKQNIDLMFKNGKIAIEPLEYSIYPKENTPIDPTLFYTKLTFNKPIREIKAHKLLLKLTASETLNIAQDEVHIKDNVVTITKKIPPLSKNKDANMTLDVDTGAFISVEKTLNKSKTHKYLCKNLEESSSIAGTVTTEAAGFIIQLLDDKYNVLDEKWNQKTYAFTDLVPGVYRIRILVTSASGEWYCGDINTFTPPNKVVFSDPLFLIANWEFEHIDFQF